VNVSTGLVDAFAWLRDNAVSDTEYLVRVERDETDLPRFVLTYTKTGASNVTLRLKGTSNAPQKTFTDGTLTDPGGWKLSPNDKRSGAGGVMNFAGGEREMSKAFFDVGEFYTFRRSVFILGSNITVKGFGSSQYSNTKAAFYVRPNAGLIMERGSAIADWYTNTDHETCSTIYVESNGDASRDPSKHGQLRIEGGSFVNNTVHEDHYLIRVNGREDRLGIGSIYRAASTPANPVIFSGNSNDTLFFYSASSSFYPSTSYDLGDLTGEVSRPEN
jgi:hypothetical protein